MRIIKTKCNKSSRKNQMKINIKSKETKQQNNFVYFCLFFLKIVVGYFIQFKFEV